MPSKAWKDSLFTFIWLFSIGRGISVFIRTGLNQAMIYDVGSSDEFSPADFVSKHLLPSIDKYDNHQVAQVVISHPHLDHIREIERLREGSNLSPSLLTCPHDKENVAGNDERIDWTRITNPDGADSLIDTYKALYEKRKLPLQTIRYQSDRSVPNLEYGVYYVRPPEVAKLLPKDDQAYSNGVSLVLFLRHGSHTILIPGDMTPEIMEHLLDEGKGSEKRYTVFSKSFMSSHPDWSEKTSNQPSLKDVLSKYGVSILVAPHHGLESGYCQALYDAMRNGKPKLVVISEKRHLSPSDGKVDKRYHSPDGAEGLDIEVEGKKEKHYSFSTRNGHHILVVFEGTGGAPRVYADTDPTRLLNKL